MKSVLVLLETFKCCRRNKSGRLMNINYKNSKLDVKSSRGNGITHEKCDLVGMLTYSSIYVIFPPFHCLCPKSIDFLFHNVCLFCQNTHIKAKRMPVYVSHHMVLSKFIIIISDQKYIVVIELE